MIYGGFIYVKLVYMWSSRCVFLFYWYFSFLHKQRAFFPFTFPHSVTTQRVLFTRRIPSYPPPSAPRPPPDCCTISLHTRSVCCCRQRPPVLSQVQAPSEAATCQIQCPKGLGEGRVAISGVPGPETRGHQQLGNTKIKGGVELVSEGLMSKSGSGLGARACVLLGTEAGSLLIFCSDFQEDKPFSRILAISFKSINQFVCIAHFQSQASWQTKVLHWSRSRYGKIETIKTDRIETKFKLSIKRTNEQTDTT